jgi:hypothetical protein
MEPFHQNKSHVERVKTSINVESTNIDDSQTEQVETARTCLLSILRPLSEHDFPELY